MVNSPVESYLVNGDNILVKREDKCADDKNYPPFSKIRGLSKRVQHLKSKGYKVFGYTESAVSMAGWGVAYVCKQLGVKAVIYNPVYITENYKGREILKLHREKWKEFDADIRDIPASMVKVNFYICRKDLLKNYEDAIMLPLGLPFEESIQQTSIQLSKVKEYYNSIVVCIGSGTITAGLLRETKKPIYGIMTRSGSIEETKKKITKKANVIFLNPNLLRVINPGWEYTQKSEAGCPFESHPYYDLKAWEWLVNNKNDIPKPVIFWNIGRKV